MPRSQLPTRRPSSNCVIDFEGQRFAITIGFYPDGQPGEVFADAGKTPQAVQQIISDACILISVALQHGVTAADLGKSLTHFDNGEPYTVLGVICDMLAKTTLGGEEDEDDTS